MNKWEMVMGRLKVNSFGYSYCHKGKIVTGRVGVKGKVESGGRAGVG